MQTHWLKALWVNDLNWLISLVSGFCTSNRSLWSTKKKINVAVIIETKKKMLLLRVCTFMTQIHRNLVSTLSLFVFLVNFWGQIHTKKVSVILTFSDSISFHSEIINIFMCVYVCIYIYIYNYLTEVSTPLTYFFYILLNLFMWQHWRNYTLLQCKVVSVHLV